MKPVRLIEYTIIALVVTSPAIIPHAAHAYLDPGNGSYFLQVGLAVVLGGLVAIRAYFNRIKHALGRFFSRRKDGPTE